MANRSVFVDLGDTHGPLGYDANGDAIAAGTDVLVDDQGRKYMVQGDGAGLIAAYATLALAIAATASLVNGEFVFIAGGNDGQPGSKPNDDRGVWKVVSNAGAARSDYTQVLDVTNKASELYVDDAGGFFTATDAEAALQEIGTKQVFFKLGGSSLTGSVVGATSTSLNAALAALVIDSGTATDAVGAGSGSVSGIVQNAAFAYQIPLRDAANRDVIDDGAGNEVYARLSCPAGVYTLSFFSFVNGVETAYTFASSKAVDLGYVLVSQDFMKLPAYAGVVQGEFFGDQAGAVGNIADTQITTAGPFTGLLNGLTTQSAVNAKVDELGLSGTGQGASLIAIEDAGNLITATTVEGALAELAGSVSGKVKNYATLADAYAAAPHAIDTYLIIGGAGSTAAERGVYKVTANDGSQLSDLTLAIDMTSTASELLIVDSNSFFTGTDAEAALDEIAVAIGGTTSTTRTYSSAIYVSNNDSLVTAIGKLDAAISALSADKIVSKAFTANEAIAAAASGPQLVSQDGTAWKVNLAVAGATGPKVEIVGFATGADYAANAAITSGSGVVEAGLLGGFTGLTAGATYYADPASPGRITSTVPSIVGEWIIPVGVAVSATSLMVRIGEPNEIVPAQPALQSAIHRKSCAGVAGGIGETGYAVAVGDLWIDNDVAVQNPTKGQTGRHTLYICKAAWTGTGASITSAQIKASFIAIGTQG
jgi:hypothetical protein